MTESKTFKAVASSTWKVCEHKQGWRVTFKIFLFYFPLCILKPITGSTWKEIEKGCEELSEMNIKQIIKTIMES